MLGNMICNSSSSTCGQYTITFPCRNPVKELVLTMDSDYFGPDECIDDHVESKYFDNPEVCSNA